MDNQAGIWLAAVICTAPVIILVVFIVQRLLRISRNYRVVAEKWNGEYSSSLFAMHRRIQFSHAGTAVVFRVWVQRIFGRYTELCVAWPDSELLLECRTRSAWDWLFEWRSKRVRTSEREFDSRFVISGEPEQHVKNLVTGGVQAAVLQIQRVNFERRLVLTFGSGKLTLVCRGSLREEQHIDALLRGFCELYDQLRLVDTSKIAFVAERSTASMEPPTCQICGEEIMESAVACRRCNTLHHAECWKYFGSCSVYACGELRSRKAKLSDWKSAQLDMPANVEDDRTPKS